MKHLKKPIVVLDLGTTKFCLAAILPLRDASSNTTHKLTAEVKMVSVKARGMARGMLSHFLEAQKSLLELIDLAEKSFGFTVRELAIGIAGTHLSTRLVEDKTNKIRGTITEEKIVDWLKKREAHEKIISLEHERSLLHLIPIDYQLDDREAVMNPSGFSANSLKARYLAVEASAFYVKDVSRLCNSCGLQVMRFYAEPFASATACLKDYEREYGVALVDIGGGSTDVMVFQNGRAGSLFSINIASHLMSQDLAIAYNISYSDAEQLKIQFGIENVPHKTLEVYTHAGEKLTFNGHLTQKVLKPRVDEWLAQLIEYLRLYKGKLGSGVVLTGGGAQLRGLDQYLSQQLRIPVRVGQPFLDYQLKYGSDIMSSYATAFGLLNLELNHFMVSSSYLKAPWPLRPFLSLRHWLKDF